MENRGQIVVKQDQDYFVKIVGTHHWPSFVTALQESIQNDSRTSKF
jgi:hypothetical protein